MDECAAFDRAYREARRTLHEASLHGPARVQYPHCAEDCYGT